MQQSIGLHPRSIELDGLRGIAILMVLETHYGVLSHPLALASSNLSRVFAPLLAFGWSGVDLFFVLSGFLLGGILMDNKDASNYFKVFYTRRICRIFPLYFLVVIPLLVIPLPLISSSLNSIYVEPLPSWTYLTYTQNIAMAQEERWGTVWLGPTWSLAVEEQFYLILPFLIRFVSKERLPYLFVSLILMATLSRLAILAFHPHGDFAFFLLLPSRAEPLLLGVLGAWAVRNQRCLHLLHTHRRLLYGVLAILAGSTVLLVLGFYRHPTDVLTTLFPATYGYLLLGLLFTCILLIAVTEKRGIVSFVTRNRLLGKIGVIAYGVYLLHVPVQGLLVWFLLGEAPFSPVDTTPEVLVTFGALLLTLGIATISWVLFEKRIVSWGRSFKYDSPVTP
jgi:peptidoglycan/LPS O-acetylase OafA/YrhL